MEKRSDIEDQQQRSPAGKLSIYTYCLPPQVWVTLKYVPTISKKYLLLFLLLPFFAKGQIITTICGTGVGGTSIEGVPASASPIVTSGGGAFDFQGNFYFAQSKVGGDCRISKISTLGIISTVAGTGVPGYSGDGGPATLAQLKYPNPPGVDKYGNIYIPDGNNNRIRKVDVNTGIITTIAGTGVGGFNGDGIPATAAMIKGPSAVVCDKTGNIYIADFNNDRVRKIDTAGIISTIVGTGVLGFSGDGGPATAAKIKGVLDIKFDASGNLYMADIDNGRIRKMDTIGMITTVAGNGIYTYNGDNIPATNAQIGPYSVGVDIFGNIFIGDVVNQLVRYVDKSGFIHTVTGTTVAGYNGDGIAATGAELYHPYGIAFDSCDNIYIDDSWNYRIRKVTYPKCNYLDAPEIENMQSVITIYPIPTENDLHINNLTTTTQYRLMTTTGATQQRGTLKPGNNTIPLHALPTGLYLLELTDEQGSRTVRKILKQ